MIKLILPSDLPVDLLCYKGISTISMNTIRGFLVLKPEHSLLEGSHPSAEMQSLYFTAPANWDDKINRINYITSDKENPGYMICKQIHSSQLRL